MDGALEKQTYGQRGTADSEGLRFQIPGGPDAAGQARSGLGRLRSDIDPPLMESVRLLVTELITNAVRHAKAPTLEMTVLVAASRVHIEISNPGGGFEPRPSDPSDHDTGWGLFLVDRLSDDWGVVDDGRSGYQRVWFELTRA
jgi:anti-sigma regulatory factor (Ser/Thr protein kinase)